MFTHLVFWLWFAGLGYLFAGLFILRHDLRTAHGLDRWIVLGPVFVAAPLATFAMEHFVDAAALAQLVPVWMPARLFWACFVGCALLAAATSIVARRFVRLSATLLGVLFLLFVLTIYLPSAIRHPGVLLAWNYVLRETAFAGGALALASRRRWMVLFGRIAIAGAVTYFGIEQLLRPAFTPGVPDSQLTPAWVPLHAFWGYPVGAFLVCAGLALLLNRKPRLAATSIGLLMTLLTVILYLPILAITHDPALMTDAINFVADTLLFGGTALVLAQALSPIRNPA